MYGQASRFLLTRGRFHAMPSVLTSKFVVNRLHPGWIGKNVCDDIGLIVPGKVTALVQVSIHVEAYYFPFNVNTVICLCYRRIVDSKFAGLILAEIFFGAALPEEVYFCKVCFLSF